MNSASLIAQLSHTDYGERRRAEDALVALGESAVLPLINVVEIQPFVPALRAASALSRLGDTRGILPVARLLLRESQQKDVIAWLGGWRPRPTQKNEPERTLIELARLRNDVMADGRAASVAEFFHCLYQHSPQWRPLQLKADALETETPCSISDLIGFLDTPNPGRAEVVASLLIQEGRAAVPMLLAALGTKRGKAYQRILEILGHIGDERAVEPLRRKLSLLGSEGHYTAQFALITLSRGFGAQPAPAQIPVLISLVRYLRADLPHVVDTAAKVLQRLAEIQPTPQLRGALKWLQAKGLWSVSPSSDMLRAAWAIENATWQWKDLPLTATAPEKMADLPLPATEEALLGQSEGENQQ